MARITVEDCLKRVPSRFLLVNMVAKRVRQIREGSEYLVSSPKNEDIVVSLREIAAGKLTVKLKKGKGSHALSAAADSPAQIAEAEPAEVEVALEAEAAEQVAETENALPEGAEGEAEGADLEAATAPKADATNTAEEEVEGESEEKPAGEPEKEASA